MTTFTQLRDYVDEKKQSHPHLSEVFEDYYALAVAEVEEGGSTQHEINLCIGSIEETIEDDTK